MTTTPYLGIPELAQQQANADITHNEALVLIQALLNGVKDKDLSTPPVTPSEGDAYIIGAAPTGAWSGRANSVAIYWGASWRFVPGNDDSGTPITMGVAQEGLRVWLQDENRFYVWCGSPQSWVAGPGNPVLASQVSFTPGGTVAATDVQTAIAEVASEKVAKTGDSMNGDLTLTDGAKYVARNDAGQPALQADVYVSASTGVTVRGRKARGSFAAPSNVATNDNLTSFNAQGYGGGGFRNAGDFNYQVIAATPSATDMECRWKLFLSPAGSITLTEILRADHATGLSMFGANPVIDQDRVFRRRVYTVATLPANVQGKSAHVSDANAPVFGAAVAGGGAVSVPVYNTGAGWFVG